MSVSGTVSHRLGHRPVRWGIRALAALAIAVGLLAMHWDDVRPTADAATPAMSSTMMSGTTMSSTACAMTNWSVAAPAMMSGSMSCAGMLAGSDPQILLPDAAGHPSTPTRTTTLTVRPGADLAHWGRVCPEVLRT